MLSAFVFGAAEHVKTPVWMKLDADCTPVQKTFQWPAYASYGILGHKCGYTKTKGQANPPSHFLNQLDEWWRAETGEEPIFPLIDGSRHRHKRIASFCWIEKTEHTRWMAEAFGDRLPVPSQDTCSWYCAVRRGLQWKRENMRTMFTP